MDTKEQRRPVSAGRRPSAAKRPARKPVQNARTRAHRHRARATADTTWAMTLIKMPTEEKSEPTYRAVEPYSLEMMPSSVPLPPRRSRTA